MDFMPSLLLLDLSLYFLCVLGICSFENVHTSVGVTKKLRWGGNLHKGWWERSTSAVFFFVGFVGYE
jgi:hypothetical protein